MQFDLTLHPQHGRSPIDRILVSIQRTTPNDFHIGYRLFGRIAAIRIPAPATPMRRDELWKHTCFECFVTAAGPEYLELNFSPSTEWAAYRFASYRTGMQPLPIASPRIEASVSDTMLVAANFAIDPDYQGSLRLGVCAIVESDAGELFYWALAHPTGKADFHHPIGFSITLP